MEAMLARTPRSEMFQPDDAAPQGGSHTRGDVEWFDDDARMTGERAGAFLAREFRRLLKAKLAESQAGRTSDVVEPSGSRSRRTH